MLSVTQIPQCRLRSPTESSSELSVTLHQGSPQPPRTTNSHGGDALSPMYQAVVHFAWGGSHAG